MTSASGESPIWIEQLKICSYDVDFTRHATSTSLCRYFLEAAWNHAEALGVGFAALAKQDKYWVLSRFRLEIVQPAPWGTPVTLRTWPRAIKSVFAMRDFELADGAGARFAAGSSAWLVLDAASRRPQRLQKLLPSFANLGDRTALNRDPEKLPELDTWETTYSVCVRYTDIDVNRHVNSSRYIGWILDAYPWEFHNTHAVRSLEINYLSETVAGEVLTIRTRATEPHLWSHSLCKADGHEVCRARLEWT
jgi:medium-chain acyl-[acyl-carrier-protein] hydrolase